MSQSQHNKQRIGPVLRPSDVQLIHAHKRIKYLEDRVERFQAANGELWRQQSEATRERDERIKVTDDIFALTVDALDWDTVTALRNIMNQIAHYCRRHT